MKVMRYGDFNQSASFSHDDADPIALKSKGGRGGSKNNSGGKKGPKKKKSSSTSTSRVVMAIVVFGGIGLIPIVYYGLICLGCIVKKDQDDDY